GGAGAGVAARPADAAGIALLARLALRVRGAALKLAHARAADRLRGAGHAGAWVAAGPALAGGVAGLGGSARGAARARHHLAGARSASARTGPIREDVGTGQS